MTGIYIGLAFYIVVTFVMSIWSAKDKAVKTSKGFIVGNRGYGPVVTSLSMGTTLASGFAFIGMVGSGYTMGIMASWQCIFGTILEFFCWYFLAKKCRELAIKTDSVTPTEIISHIHGDPGNLIKIIGGLFIGVFMVLYLAGQFNGAAVAAKVINLNPLAICITIAVLTMIFIFMGGMNAAMWTNAIQGVVMIFAFILMIGVALSHVGGMGSLFSQLSVTSPELIDWRGSRTSGAAVFYICNYWLGSSMGFLAQPQAVQKFLTLKESRKARVSALLSCIFNIIRQLGPVLIGMCCRLLYPDIADPSSGIPQLVVDYLPNFLGGIVIAGIIAAIMSTTEGLLLQAVAEVSSNVLKLGFFAKKEISDKKANILNKVLTILFSVAALLVTMYGSGGVFTLIVFAWTGLVAIIGPALYFGLYWKKCTSQGILASIIVSAPTCIAWYFLVKPTTGLHEAWSLIFPVAAIIIVSLLTKDKPQLEDNFPA